MFKVILAVLILVPSLCMAGTVNLQWGAVSNATEYRVYMMPVGGDATATRTPAQTVTAPATTASLTVDPGAHAFYVTAANAWGESGPSNVVTTPGMTTAPVLQLTGFTLTVTGEIVVR